MWTTLTDTSNEKIEVNLAQALTMQVFNDQTTITFGLIVNEILNESQTQRRPYTVTVKESPQEIWKLVH